VAKKFLMFNTLCGCPFAPKTKAGGLEGFSHVGDHLALGETSDFKNFFKGDPVRPGCPDYPIGAMLRWFRFFDPGNWTIGLLGIHEATILDLYLPWAN
jgi:hypothetical protein